MDVKLKILRNKTGTNIELQNPIKPNSTSMHVQFHPMMPSATAIDPFIDLAITETLRPMIPESPTPRSRRCRNCITEKESVWRGNERNGFAGD